MRQIEIRLAARDDIDAVADFYAQAGLEIAERWIDAVQRLVGDVARRPSFGSTSYAELTGVDGLRHRQVSRFPYLLFYLELEHAIVLVRVLHERRDVAAQIDE